MIAGGSAGLSLAFQLAKELGLVEDQLALSFREQIIRPRATWCKTTYIYIHIDICIHIVHIYIYTYTHVYVYVYVYVYVNAYSFVEAKPRMRVCMNRYTG